MAGKPRMMRAGDAAGQMHVALLLGPDAGDVYGPSLRHLCVGLLDEGIRVSVVFDERLDAAALTLAPGGSCAVPARWLWAPRRRLQEIGESLADEDCTLVHVLSESALPWLPALLAPQLLPVVGTLTHTLGPADTSVVAGESTISMSHARDGQWLQSALGGPLRTLPSRLMDAEALSASRYVTRWTALSQAVAEAHRWLSGDVALVPLGILADEGRIQGTSELHRAGLLTVAPFHQSYRLQVLIDAYARLVREGFDFLAFIGGSGPDEASLRGQIRHLKLNSRVTIAPPLCDWRTSIGSLDIYVQPYRSTQVRSDLFEGMSLGMACVAASDSAEGCIRHGYDGLLINSGDVRELVDALRLLLQSRELSSEMGRAACRTIARDYSACDMVNRMIAVYRQTLRPARRLEDLARAKAAATAAAAGEAMATGTAIAATTTGASGAILEQKRAPATAPVQPAQAPPI